MQSSLSSKPNSHRCRKGSILLSLFRSCSVSRDRALAFLCTAPFAHSPRKEPKPVGRPDQVHRAKPKARYAHPDAGQAQGDGVVPDTCRHAAVGIPAPSIEIVAGLKPQNVEAPLRPLGASLPDSFILGAFETAGNGDFGLPIGGLDERAKLAALRRCAFLGSSC